MTVSKVSLFVFLWDFMELIKLSNAYRFCVTCLFYFFFSFFSPPGTVSVREISEMKARLFLNLGLVYDHLGEPKRCSEFIRRSVFIAE